MPITQSASMSIPFLRALLIDVQDWWESSGEDDIIYQSICKVVESVGGKVEHTNIQDELKCVFPQGKDVVTLLFNPRHLTLQIHIETQLGRIDLQKSEVKDLIEDLLGD